MPKKWSEDGFARIVEGAKKSAQLSKLRSEKTKEEYYKNPKLCLECGSAIPYEKKSQNKFCNKSCSAKYNNKGVRRHGNPSKKNESLPRTILQKPTCIQCGETCKINKAKYCSNKCQHIFQYNQRLENWISGKSTPSKRNFFVKYLTETYGYKCSCCGISEWNKKPIVLEIDHIDGNSENNEPDNLRLICPNCHSQTETYKGKNAGNGRHYRRIRYASGQSY